LEKKIEEIKKKFPEPPKRKITDTKDTARKKRKQLSKSKYKKGIKKKGKRV
jgi:nucleolar protein 56